MRSTPLQPFLLRRVGALGAWEAGARTTLLVQLRTLGLGVALALAALPSSANCYYLYSSTHQLLYRSQTPPVDLSLPLQDAVAALNVPGLRLVFTTSTALCEGTLNLLSTYRASPAARQGRSQPRRSMQ